jgi:hypothetical protein
LAALLVIVELAYVFIISAGTFTHWPIYSNYYDLMAEGFRAGHLDLPIKPYPELLARADPFDRANSDLWLWDASLYDGKYFFYWGPLPALFQAAAKSILGIQRLIGDQYLLFAFSTLYLVFGTLILERLARRLFPSLPAGLLVLAVLVFAFANPIPHGLASAFVYQAAIMGGQAFLMLGVLFAFDAVWSTAGGERASGRLVLAGIAWGLALACRISLAPAVAALILVTALATARPERNRLARLITDGLRLGAPVAAASGALLLYNKLRFGAWTDFGVDLQLATLKLHSSASYIPMNLYSYALRPFEWSSRFPFALQIADLEARGVQRAEWLGAGYSTPEPVVGFLLAVPWTWIVPIGAFVCAERGLRRFLPSNGSEPDRRFRTAAWCCASFVILATLTGIMLLPMFVSTMRYLADFTPGTVLTAILCAWCLWSVTPENGWMRRICIAGCAALGSATVLLGLLFGVQGYRDHFRVQNPKLYDRAVETFSFGHSGAQAQPSSGPRLR